MISTYYDRLYMRKKEQETSVQNPKNIVTYKSKLKFLLEGKEW